MQFSIYWFRKRKKEIEIMSLFGKKKDEKRGKKQEIAKRGNRERKNRGDLEPQTRSEEGREN